METLSVDSKETGLEVNTEKTRLVCSKMSIAVTVVQCNVHFHVLYILELFNSRKWLVVDSVIMYDVKVSFYFVAFGGALQPYASCSFCFSVLCSKKEVPGRQG